MTIEADSTCVTGRICGNEDHGSGSTPSVKPRLWKNAPGNRSNVSWKYGTEFEGNPKKISCKFCKKVIPGGVYRFKHHLAKTQKNTDGGISVPSDVQKEMVKVLALLEEKSIKKRLIEQEMEGLPEDAMEVEDLRGKRQVNSMDLFKKIGSTQATINAIFKKDLREEACEEIALFFYNNTIPFNVAKSDEFKKMFELVARHGPGFKPPSYHENRVKFLNKKVGSTKEDMEVHKAQWKKTGCTVMTDGWTDNRRRTLLNFLVNSPKGTVFLKSIDASHISKTAEKVFKMMDEVVDEIGEENVVQFVTDNVVSYKAAGEMLMEKRKKLFWTPCAAHCIDLMLEDFEKKIPVHKETIALGKRITTYIDGRTALICLLHSFTHEKDLVRPALIRFATSYLTLACMYDNKGALVRMFTSNEWKSGKLAKSRDGKFIEIVVMDKVFWKNIVMSLRSTYPLIKVLRLVDSDQKPAMGFIFEAIEQAKEKIQLAFNGVKKSYMPIWDIIDQRWDRQLHRPLPAAGYFFNPRIQYSPHFKCSHDVKRVLYDCMERLADSMDEVEKIDAQLEDFKSRSGFFGRHVATAGIQSKTPAQWWESYGDECPELQKFAIRVLSLTCSSSGCERN